MRNNQPVAVKFADSLREGEKGQDSFTAADHLLGIVQRSVASRCDTRIVLPSQGEVVLFPKQNIYYTDVSNMAEFCCSPANHFESKPLEHTESSNTFGSGKNISDLLWQCAFHVSQGRLIEGCLKYDVVQFRHWPNLTRLPITINTARICALLTRHPTTVMLIHRVLGIDKKEVYQIYSAAYSAGIAHIVSRNQILNGVEDNVSDTPFEQVQERGIFRLLFAKIAGL
jgi:hypothetical protein